MRSIEDIIVKSRSDLSPFLVHLTRSHDEHKLVTNGLDAKGCLRSIIECKVILAGTQSIPEGAMSDARFAIPRKELNQRKSCLEFVSFTEIPLPLIKHLFDIANRKINLEPYGLVFLKDNLKKRGVSPVFYVNNACGDKDPLVKALTMLPLEIASQILPLIAVFGQKLQPVEASLQPGEQDFMWEREWRFPGDALPFDEPDVLVGLCPDNEIKEFEKLFPGVRFIDPKQPMGKFDIPLCNALMRVGLDPSSMLHLLVRQT
jgi:hypothetical protein